MDINIGNILLLLALCFSFYSFSTSLAGYKKDIFFLKRTSIIGFHLGTASIVGALVFLIIAFLSNRFEFEYVFSNSNRAEAVIYKLISFYAGKEGSLLMWALFLSISSSIYVVSLNRKKESNLHYVLFVLSAIQLFFNAIIFFKSSPFAIQSFIPEDGKGLNPLLENFYMILHPPALYLGFIFFTIPFARALVSLFQKQYDGSWVSETKNWILLAWFFLGLGNVLGSYWAYIELGWGGYWGWDPVENSSFIPWLFSTALIHSVIVERKIKMFRGWNYLLIFLTFISTITATYITRSGIVSSGHTFPKTAVADYLLGFIILLVLVSFGLLALRCRSISRENVVDSVSSKEACFLTINSIFLFSSLGVFIGTLIPVISKVFLSNSITLEPSDYDGVFSIIGLFLLFGLGVCPLLKWRKNFSGFLSIGVLGWTISDIISAILAIYLGERALLSILSYSLSGGALFTTVFRVVIGLKKENLKTNETSIPKYVWSSITRYGGAVAHFGIVVMFIGITGTGERVELEKNLAKGDEYLFNQYRIVNKGFKYMQDERKEMVYTILDIFKGDKKIATLEPAKFFYQTMPGEKPRVTTEMAVYSTLKEDLAIVMLSFNLEDHIVNIKIINNPLIFWIWLGSVFLFAGTLVRILGLRKNINDEKEA